MTKFIATFAALTLVSIAAPAIAAESQTMTRDGVTYVYSVEQTPKATLIKGREQGGRAFSLRVANGRVSGYSDGRNVSFPLSSVVHSTPAPTEISSR
ncbi:MAG: hypothetical protein JWO15_3327 [Sphingomonadales bacterium]|nr:hypothetical protein [Sphingomonadales bacterium]